MSKLSAHLLPVVTVIGSLLMITSCHNGEKPADTRSGKADSFQNARTPYGDTSSHSADTSTKTGIKSGADHQDIKNIPSASTGFIPEGYTAIDTTYGDLNLDQYADKILVLKKNGEDTAMDPESDFPRMLVILLGQKDSTFKLAAYSDKAVLCAKCGGVLGDPYVDVVIKKGYFSIEHSGGSRDRWERTTTFKYSPADSTWYMYKDGNAGFMSETPEKKKTTISTVKDFGKVAFEKFDASK